MNLFKQFGFKVSEVSGWTLAAGAVLERLTQDQQRPSSFHMGRRWMVKVAKMKNIICPPAPTKSNLHIAWLFLPEPNPIKHSSEIKKKRKKASLVNSDERNGNRRAAAPDSELTED